MCLCVRAGLGPVFVAFFIQRLGRTGAFNLSTAGWIPCGLLLMGTGARACPLAPGPSPGCAVDPLVCAHGHSLRREQRLHL